MAHERWASGCCYPGGPCGHRAPRQPVFQGQHRTGAVMRQSLHNPPKPLRAIHTLHQRTSDHWPSAKKSSSILRSGGQPRWSTACCPRPGRPQPATATLRGKSLLASNISKQLRLAPSRQARYSNKSNCTPATALLKAPEACFLLSRTTAQHKVCDPH